MKRILQWAASAGALLALPMVVPGLRIIDFNTALVVALVYGLVVTAAHVLLIPLAYTLFLFVPRLIWNLACLFVVNGGVMLLLAHYIKGFAIAGWQPAVIAAVALAAVNWIAGKLFDN